MMSEREMSSAHSFFSFYTLLFMIFVPKFTLNLFNLNAQNKQESAVHKIRGEKNIVFLYFSPTVMVGLSFLILFSNTDTKSLEKKTLEPKLKYEF